MELTRPLLQQGQGGGIESQKGCAALLVPLDETRAFEYADVLAYRWQRQSPHVGKVVDRGRLLPKEANDLAAVSIRECVENTVELVRFRSLRSIPLMRSQWFTSW